MPADWPWLRLYSEARVDAKLRALSDAEHRVWFNLLCYAGEQDKRGVIDTTDDFLLAVECAGGDEQLLRDTITKLERLAIVVEDIDDRKLWFISWDDRQYDKPSDRPEATAERKRRSREKQARESESHAPPSNKEWLSREVTPSHDPEEDTERELETDTELEREPEADLPGSPVAESPYQVLEVLFEATERDIGKLTTREKNSSLAVAKRLLADGVTCAEVRGYVAYLAAQAWRTEPATMFTVEKGIGTWRASGSPAVPKMPSRASPSNGLKPEERRPRVPKFEDIAERYR